MNEETTTQVYLVNEEPAPLKDQLAITAVAAVATVAATAAVYGVVVGGVALVQGGTKLVRGIVTHVKARRSASPAEEPTE